MPRATHLLNTHAIDGLRAIAILHIVLGHHSYYTGYHPFDHHVDHLGEVRQPTQADLAAASAIGGCAKSWCTSPGSDVEYDCWAGSMAEPCTCEFGEARLTGEEAPYEGQTYYEYTCCHTDDGSNVGYKCGDYFDKPFEGVSQDDPLYRAP